MGPTGPIGEREPVGAPGPRGEPGIFRVVTEYADDFGTLASGGLLHAEMTCPDHGLVLSAGFSTYLMSGSPGDLVVVESLRLDNSTWAVTAVNGADYPLEAALLVMGTCADIGEGSAPGGMLPQ